MNLTKTQWQKIGGVVITALLVIASIAGWYFPVDAPAPSPNYVVTEEEQATIGAQAAKERVTHLIAKKLTVLAGGAEFQSAVDLGDTLDLDGNKLILDADADTSLTADTDDQLDLELAGVDTLVYKAFPTSATVTATVNIQEIQGTSPAWTANTNVINALDIDLSVGNANTGTHTIRGVMIDAITGDAQVTETGLQIGTGWDTAAVLGGLLDVNDALDLDGSSDEVQLAVTGYTTQTSDLVNFDGGLTDIGGGTYATADGDNDLGVAGDVEIEGSLNLDGLVNFGCTSYVTTGAQTITFTASCYQFNTGGTLTATLGTSGVTTGTVIYLMNIAAQDVVIVDTNIRTADGNGFTMNQYDTSGWQYSGSEWYLLYKSANQ